MPAGRRRLISSRGRTCLARAGDVCSHTWTSRLSQDLSRAADERVRGHAGPLAIWAGMFVLYFVWGSTYIGIRLADESIPPFLMAGVRFLVAGVLLLLAWEWLAIRRIHG